MYAQFNGFLHGIIHVQAARYAQPQCDQQPGLCGLRLKIQDFNLNQVSRSRNNPARITPTQTVKQSDVIIPAATKNPQQVV